uniref:RNA-dependent RNA polymerase n=1 Tax=Beihai hermit crab virus 2 TaxID=1922389 RepID=A0A1L3KPG9_9VIRU|nr:RNA-dependent RNA polymerase [Beihai hermit crab virus 2]
MLRPEHFNDLENKVDKQFSTSLGYNCSPIAVNYGFGRSPQEPLIWDPKYTKWHKHGIQKLNDILRPDSNYVRFKLDTNDTQVNIAQIYNNGKACEMSTVIDQGHLKIRQAITVETKDHFYYREFVVLPQSVEDSIEDICELSRSCVTYLPNVDVRTTTFDHVLKANTLHQLRNAVSENNTLYIDVTNSLFHFWGNSDEADVVCKYVVRGDSISYSLETTQYVEGTFDSSQYQGSYYMPCTYNMYGANAVVEPKQERMLTLTDALELTKNNWNTTPSPATGLSIAKSIFNNTGKNVLVKILNMHLMISKHPVNVYDYSALTQSCIVDKNVGEWLQMTGLTDPKKYRERHEWHYQRLDDSIVGTGNVTHILIGNSMDVDVYIDLTYNAMHYTTNFKVNNLNLLGMISPVHMSALKGASNSHKVAIEVSISDSVDIMHKHLGDNYTYTPSRCLEHVNYSSHILHISKKVYLSIIEEDADSVWCEQTLGYYATTIGEQPEYDAYEGNVNARASVVAWANKVITLSRTLYYSASGDNHTKESISDLVKSLESKRHDLLHRFINYCLGKAPGERERPLLTTLSQLGHVNLVNHIVEEGTKAGYRASSLPAAKLTPDIVVIVGNLVRIIDVAVSVDPENVRHKKKEKYNCLADCINSAKEKGATNLSAQVFPIIYNERQDLSNIIAGLDLEAYDTKLGQIVQAALVDTYASISAAVGLYHDIRQDITMDEKEKIDMQHNSLLVYNHEVIQAFEKRYPNIKEVYEQNKDLTEDVCSMAIKQLLNDSKDDEPKFSSVRDAVIDLHTQWSSEYIYTDNELDLQNDLGRPMAQPYLMSSTEMNGLNTELRRLLISITSAKDLCKSYDSTLSSWVGLFKMVVLDSTLDTYLTSLISGMDENNIKMQLNFNLDIYKYLRKQFGEEKAKEYFNKANSEERPKIKYAKARNATYYNYLRDKAAEEGPEEMIKMQDLYKHLEGTVIPRKDIELMNKKTLEVWGAKDEDELKVMVDESLERCSNIVKDCKTTPQNLNEDNCKSYLKLTESLKQTHYFKIVNEYESSAMQFKTPKIMEFKAGNNYKADNYLFDVGDWVSKAPDSSFMIPDIPPLTGVADKLKKQQESKGKKFADDEYNTVAFQMLMVTRQLAMFLGKVNKTGHVYLSNLGVDNICVWACKRNSDKPKEVLYQVMTWHPDEEKLLAYGCDKFYNESMGCHVSVSKILVSRTPDRDHMLNSACKYMVLMNTLYEKTNFATGAVQSETTRAICFLLANRCPPNTATTLFNLKTLTGQSTSLLKGKFMADLVCKVFSPPKSLLQYYLTKELHRFYEKDVIETSRVMFITEDRNIQTSRTPVMHVILPVQCHSLEASQHVSAALRSICEKNARDSRASMHDVYNAYVTANDSHAQEYLRDPCNMMYMNMESIDGRNVQSSGSIYMNHLVGLRLSKVIANTYVTHFRELSKYNIDNSPIVKASTKGGLKVTPASDTHNPGVKHEKKVTLYMEEFTGDKINHTVRDVMETDIKRYALDNKLTCIALSAKGEISGKTKADREIATVETDRAVVCHVSGYIERSIGSTLPGEIITTARDPTRLNDLLIATSDLVVNHFQSLKSQGKTVSSDNIIYGSFDCTKFSTQSTGYAILYSLYAAYRKSFPEGQTILSIIMHNVMNMLSQKYYVDNITLTELLNANSMMWLTPGRLQMQKNITNGWFHTFLGWPQGMLNSIDSVLLNIGMNIVIDCMKVDTLSSSTYFYTNADDNCVASYVRDSDQEGAAAIYSRMINGGFILTGHKSNSKKAVVSQLWMELVSHYITSHTLTTDSCQLMSSMHKAMLGEGYGADLSATMEAYKSAVQRGAPMLGSALQLHLCCVMIDMMYLGGMEQIQRYARDKLPPALGGTIYNTDPLLTAIFGVAIQYKTSYESIKRNTKEGELIRKYLRYRIKEQVSVDIMGAVGTHTLTPLQAVDYVNMSVVKEKAKEYLRHLKETDGCSPVLKDNDIESFLDEFLDYYPHLCFIASSHPNLRLEQVIFAVATNANMAKSLTSGSVAFAHRLVKSMICVYGKCFMMNISLDDPAVIMAYVSLPDTRAELEKRKNKLDLTIQSMEKNMKKMGKGKYYNVKRASRRDPKGTLNATLMKKKATERRIELLDLIPFGTGVLTDDEKERIKELSRGSRNEIQVMVSYDEAIKIIDSIMPLPIDRCISILESHAKPVIEFCRHMDPSILVLIDSSEKPNTMLRRLAEVAYSSKFTLPISRVLRKKYEPDSVVRESIHDIMVTDEQTLNAELDDLYNQYGMSERDALSMVYNENSKHVVPTPPILCTTKKPLTYFEAASDLCVRDYGPEIGVVNQALHVHTQVLMSIGPKSDGVLTQLSNLIICYRDVTGKLPTQDVLKYYVDDPALKELKRLSIPSVSNKMNGEQYSNFTCCWLLTGGDVDVVLSLAANSRSSWIYNTAQNRKRGVWEGPFTVTRNDVVICEFSGHASGNIIRNLQCKFTVPNVITSTNPIYECARLLISFMIEMQFVFTEKDVIPLLESNGLLADDITSKMGETVISVRGDDISVCKVNKYTNPEARYVKCVKFSQQLGYELKWNITPNEEVAVRGVVKRMFFDSRIFEQTNIMRNSLAVENKKDNYMLIINNGNDLASMSKGLLHPIKLLDTDNVLKQISGEVDDDASSESSSSNSIEEELFTSMKDNQNIIAMTSAHSKSTRMPRPITKYIISGKYGKLAANINNNDKVMILAQLNVFAKMKNKSMKDAVKMILTGHPKGRWVNVEACKYLLSNLIIASSDVQPGSPKLKLESTSDAVHEAYGMLCSMCTNLETGDMTLRDMFNQCGR